jgi:pimeloyl-ACP methyl ester carboxylesterase
MKYILSILLLSLILIPRAGGQSIEEAFPVVGSDGFELDGLLAIPDGGAVERVVVLLHGSGPQSMDSDLTAVTRGGKQNLLFKDLSSALVAAGFAVVRYNKRSYQVSLELQQDPSFVQSEAYTTFASNPLNYFVDDAVAAVRQVRDRYPDAELRLFGHSQGAYVALQVSQQVPDIAGLALVGFALSSTDVMLFEQTVYRPLPLFTDLDGNGDGLLDAEELGSADPVAASLSAQMAIIDLDGDGSLSQAEMQAGNLSNLVIRDLAGSLRAQEAAYPRPAEILAGLDMDVVFFQGLWDNQTPAYNALAVQLVARIVWQKNNFRFHFFPELGHALDARDRYDDLQYSTIDPDALATIVREIGGS